MKFDNIFVFCNYRRASGSNSVVECNLAKVEVAGSNPVSRSMMLKVLSLGGREKEPSGEAGTLVFSNGAA